MLLFLRFVREGMIVNEYFFCQELRQTTIGVDIFKLVDENLKKTQFDMGQLHQCLHRWGSCDARPSQGFRSKFQIKLKIEETLKSPSTSFLKYFPKLDTSESAWVINPFMEFKGTSLGDEEEENLIDLRNELVIQN